MCVSVRAVCHCFFTKWERRHTQQSAQKRAFRVGDTTSENTQPSQNGGSGESIEGEGKDWISDFPGGLAA